MDRMQFVHLTKYRTQTSLLVRWCAVCVFLNPIPIESGQINIDNRHGLIDELNGSRPECMKQRERIEDAVPLHAETCKMGMWAQSLSDVRCAFVKCATIE